MDWNNIIQKCTQRDLLKAPFGREIYKVDDKYVCKISNGKVDGESHWYAPKESWPKLDDILERDLNEFSILKQIENQAPVPKVYYYKRGIMIQELIKGESLMSLWRSLEEEDIIRIKNEVVGVIRSLKDIKVDTVPITLDKRYNKAFEGELLFLHSDLNPSNILVEKIDGSWKLSGIVDWEYAGYFNINVISDINKDMCVRGKAIGLNLWADLYDLVKTSPP